MLHAKDDDGRSEDDNQTDHQPSRPLAAAALGGPVIAKIDSRVLLHGVHLRFTTS